MVAVRAIVAGTGFEGREQIIRRHCREGMKVRLIREPKNEDDPNAIAVYLLVPSLLFLKVPKMIGYIKAHAASTLHARLDAGETPNAAYVTSYWCAVQQGFPDSQRRDRVSDGNCSEPKVAARAG